MSWTKLISINFLIVIFLLIIIELMAGVGRLIIGKDFRIPFQTSDLMEVKHPCIEMKTDVLLNNVHNNPENCVIKEGKVAGEYVVYNFSDNKPVLLTLGGSTTSSFYQHYSDGQTWPKYLSELFDEEYSVINGGIGGYSSLQELYKFIRDAPRFKNLNTIISLNGINELPNYHGRNDNRKSQYPFLTDVQYTINKSQVWIDQRIHINILENLTPNISSFLKYILSNKQLLKNEYENAEQFDLYWNDIDAVDRWEINVKRIYALAEQQGARYLVFLQPTMGLEGIQSYAPPGSNDSKLLENLPKDYINELRDLYSKLALRCSFLEFCVDISSTASPTGNIYFDARHHNALGNKKIADKIYEEIHLRNKSKN